MTNALYPLARESFLNREISWRDDAIRCVLIDTTQYTLSDAHRFLSDVPALARVATCAALTGKSTAAGVADAADPTFVALAGPVCALLVIYQDTGDPATSRLIAHLDVATGLPVTPNGGDELISWDNGQNRIFKL